MRDKSLYDKLEDIKLDVSVEALREVLEADGVLDPSDIPDAERQAVLHANAMLTLADNIEERRLDAVGRTARITFTLSEMDLICHALRAAADADG